MKKFVLLGMLLVGMTSCTAFASTGEPEHKMTANVTAFDHPVLAVDVVSVESFTDIAFVGVQFNVDETVTLTKGKTFDVAVLVYYWQSSVNVPCAIPIYKERLHEDKYDMIKDIGRSNCRSNC